MTFGEEGKVGARVHDFKDVGAILDVFRAHGHDEVDAARTYSGGTCEEYLGNIDWQKRGLRIDTKLSPKVCLPLIEQTCFAAHHINYRMASVILRK